MQYSDFFLNNQPDALIIPILLCYKTLHVSGIFSAHHQEFSTVHSALVSFVQVSDDRFQAESGWNQPDSAWKRSSETCTKLASVECTVENSWWWAEKFHAGFWWPLPRRVRMVPSWLCLEAVIRNLHETHQCRLYSRKLLMMGREDARNM